MNELLPCPFCDGEPLIDSTVREGYERRRDDPDANAWFVRCRSCAAQGGWAKTESGARRWWNMRPRNAERDHAR